MFAPAIWWGLPVAATRATAHGWDVDAVTGLSTLAELANLFGGARPDWYVAYPGFHYLLLGAVYAPYLALVWATGGLAAPTAGYPYGLSDPVEVIRDLAVLGRLVSLAMAVGTVLAAYWTAKTAWNRRAGVIAAVAVMLVTPIVYRARTGNLDGPTLFWTALGIATVVSAARRGLTLRRAVLIGLFAALSTATKDQAYAIWLGALPLLFLGHLRGTLPRPPGGRPPWLAPAATVAVGVAVYLVANGIPFDPSRFAGHLRFVLDYREPRLDFAALGLERPRTFAGVALLARDLVRGIAIEAGIPLLLAGTAGLAVTARRGPVGRLLLAMLAGWFVFFVVPIQHVQPRYTMAPAYLLALPAGWLLGRGWERGGAWRAGATALMVAGAAVQLVFAGDLTYQMLRDARLDAEAFLHGRLDGGARFAYWGDAGQLPREPRAEYVSFEPAGVEETRLRLADEGIDRAVVAGDYTTPAGGRHSLFLPDPVYEALEDGSLGFERVAAFETVPPFGRRYPFVNPPIAIYERRR